MEFFKRLFSFSGRFSRMPYWIITICASILASIFGYLPFLVPLLVEGTDYAEVISILAYVCGGILYIPFMWVLIATQVKRWHDRDKSGWYYFVNFIPLVGGLWTLIECGFMEGTPGPNQYGDSNSFYGDDTHDLEPDIVSDRDIITLEPDVKKTEYLKPSAISRKPKANAWLVTKDNRQYQLNQGDTKIGRSSENDICLCSSKVSSRHAIIREKQGHFYLHDLASTNGTYINDRKVDGTVLLQPNDIIVFGGVKAQFVAAGH